jgi:hypothetical protein
MAHVGKGQMAILKKIVVKPKRTFLPQDPALQTYSVEFQFVNAKAVDASHFLLSNGLNNAMHNHEQMLKVVLNNESPKLA